MKLSYQLYHQRVKLFSLNVQLFSVIVLILEKNWPKLIMQICLGVIIPIVVIIIVVAFLVALFIRRKGRPRKDITTGRVSTAIPVMNSH